MKKIHLVKFLFLFMIIGTITSCRKAEKTRVAAKKMQDFVINVSQYFKVQKDSFIVIPQNGVELAFIDADNSKEIRQDYLSAIDGQGMEELFFDGDKPAESAYRLNMLRKIKTGKTIMVSDFFKNNSDIPTGKSQSDAENFIYFARTANNYYYQEIPTILSGENANDIHHLEDIKNYLYLISTDNYNTKEDYLNALKNTNYDMLLIDLFYDNTALTSSEVASLKYKSNGGKRLVICYMNIGSAEKYRYYWKNSWKLHHPSWLKKKYPGYSDEIYVEFWNPEWQKIIWKNSDSYANKILEAGFDGVYLDNVEAYYALYHKG